MAITKAVLGSFVAIDNGPHTLSVALAAGVGRIIVVMSARETASAISAATFNGVALTNVAGATIANVTDTQVNAASYYYDVPDALAASNYNVVLTCVSSAISYHVYQLTGAATGGPLDSDETQWSTEATNATLTLTTTTGAAMLALGITSAAASTWTISGGLTEDVESNETNYTSVVGSAIIASGTSEAVTATVSAAGTGNKCLVSTSWSPLTGPIIGTQPTAQTALTAGDNTVDFTVAATTSGGALSYDWELETSVGGGVYANLADGSGVTWTGQTAATCSATCTATTLTGRRVRCNATDSNGTTISTAVALTIQVGPSLSAYTGTTNASGVLTVDLTSDEGTIRVLIRAYIGGAEVHRTTTLPTAARLAESGASRLAESGARRLA